MKKAQEQHIHKSNRETFGGNITNAIVSGTITGLTTSLGVKGGEYLGGYLSGVSTNSTLSAMLNGVGNGFMVSTTTSVGNSMSLSTLSGGSFSDVMKAGWDNIKDKNTWFTASIVATAVGTTEGILELSHGSTSLEKGGDAVYKPDSSISQEEYIKKFGREYKGVVDRSANNISLANTTSDIDKVGEVVDKTKFKPFWDTLKEGNKFSEFINKIPGMNSMSLMHDFWTNNIIMSQTPLLQLSIFPAIAVQYCATFPSLCSSISTSIINNKDNK